MLRRGRQNLEYLIGRRGVGNPQLSRFYQPHLVLRLGEGVLGWKQETGGPPLGVKELLGMQHRSRRQHDSGQGF